MNASLSSSSCAKSAGSQLSSARLSVPHGSRCSDADRRIRLLEGVRRAAAVPSACSTASDADDVPLRSRSAWPSVATRCASWLQETSLGISISLPLRCLSLRWLGPGLPPCATRTTGVQRMSARGGGGPHPLDSSNHDARQCAPSIQEHNLGVPSCSAGRSGLAWGPLIHEPIDAQFTPASRALEGYFWPSTSGTYVV